MMWPSSPEPLRRDKVKAARNRWGNLLEGAGKSQFSEMATTPINPLIPASPSCQVIHLVFKSKT